VAKLSTGDLIKAKLKRKKDDDIYRDLAEV